MDIRIKEVFIPTNAFSVDLELRKQRKEILIEPFSFKTAKEILGGNITVAGGSIFIGIDDGMACTRMSASIGDFVWMYKTDTLLSKENIQELIKDCTDKANITLAGNVDIHYRLSSENKNSAMGMCSKDAYLIDIGESTVDCIFVR